MAPVTKDPGRTKHPLVPGYRYDLGGKCSASLKIKAVIDADEVASVLKSLPCLGFCLFAFLSFFPLRI